MHRWIWLVVMVAGCGKSSTATQGSGSAASGAGSAEPTAASGEAAGGPCTPVKLCERFPAARVDAMCGTTSSKAMPTDITSPDLVTDACTYEDSNGNRTIAIGRICGPQGREMFAGMRGAGSKAQTTVEMPGVGDEAFYRSRNHQDGELNVRTGNTLITVTNSFVTAETEEALKTKCLVAIANEAK